MEKIKEKLKENKKLLFIVVLMTIMFITMIINMLASYASVDTSKPFLELANGYDENDPDFTDTIQPDYEDFNVIPVRLYLGGFETINSLDINFSYDSELLTPVYWKRNKYVEATTIGNAFVSEDKVSVVESGTACSYLFKEESRIRFLATADFLNPNGKVLLGTFYFQISDGYGLEDITSDCFRLVKNAAGLPDGLEIDYNSVTEWVLGDNYFAVSGFSSEEEVKVTDFTVTNPSRLTYEHGDTIDFTGSMVTITYSDNTTYQETLMKAIEDKKVTIENRLADVKNPSCMVTLVEDTTKNETINLTVTDPVDTVRLSTSPATSSYLTGNDIHLDGGILEVKTKSGVVSSIQLPDNRVVCDTLIADINSPHIQGNKWTTTEGLEAGNQKITLSYTDDNGVTKTTSFTIIVNDTISGIMIKNNPTKNIYQYGDTIDLAGGNITVSTVGGSQFDLSMTDGSVNVTGFEAMPTSFPSEQNLSVSYAGKVAPSTIPITVKNYVQEIVLTNPTKTIYKYGEAIDLTNGNYRIKYANGAIGSTVSLRTSDLSNYSMKQVGSQEITVSYTDDNSDSYTYGKVFTKTFTIQINDYVTRIEITNPTDISFHYGDNFTFKGGKIEVYYASNPTTAVEIPMTSTMIKQADGSAVEMSPASELLDKKTQKYQEALEISVTRGGLTQTSHYTIDIINDVKSIKMHIFPKTDYSVNETLDLTTDGITEGEILVKRAVGIEEAISLKDSRVTITGFDSKLEHTNLPLTVTFKENGVSQTTQYFVNVRDNVSSIAMKKMPKQNYRYQDTLDITGGTITVVRASKTEDIPLQSSMVTEMDGTPFDGTNLGARNLKVTYGGQTTTYPVTVKDYVTGISVNPTSVTGDYNTELADLIANRSITYTVSYAKGGVQSSKSLTQDMVSDYSKTNTNLQNLTVTYLDNDTDSYTKGNSFTAILNVTLIDGIEEITIKKNPNRTEYGYGEAIDTTGGIITIRSKSGKTEDKTFEEAKVTLTETNGNALDLTNLTFDSNHKVIKTVQVNYEGKKATFTIEITNKIIAITMENMPKTQYKVKEELDLTTDGTTVGTIKVTRQNKETESIKLNDANVQVTGFDSTKENRNLSLTVTYTENLITQTTHYTIQIIDNVIDVVIEHTPKTQYKYAESLDVSNGTLKITRDSGEESIPMTEDMVTEPDGGPFNGKKLGTRDLIVTYGGKTLTYSVTVSDYVKGIILTPPTKVAYEYGESLDLAGGSVQAIMASGVPTSQVALSDNKVTLSTFYPNQEGTQTIQVTYEGFTQTFGVTVKDNVQDILLSKKPKTKYKYGESLNVTGGELIATKSSGKTETIPITTSMVTGYHPNQLGTQTLTVTYKGKSVNYEVTVEDYIKDISIVKPNKLVYKIGESMDLTGGQVNIVMASGKATSPLAMTNASVTVTGFNSSSEGAKLIQVTYEGFTKTFGITVVDELSSMKIKTLPNKLNYRYGESLDVTGGTIEIEKESGAKEVITMTKAMVTGYHANQLGSQTLTVTYQGFTQQFIINVEDYISKLKIQIPSKIEYEYGEALNLAGGKVSIIMASGKVKETVDMTASMVSGFNPTKEGKQTIEVEYKNLKGSFQVNVVDKIKGISLNTQPNKKIYQYGESLDLTGATIKVIKSSGISTITVTKDMISNYNPNQEGLQLVAINYGGFTTNFAVLVEKPVDKPIDKPTDKPTNKPGNKPSNLPTNNPNGNPSSNPSNKPNDKLDSSSNKNIEDKDSNITDQKQEQKVNEEWDDVRVGPTGESAEGTQDKSNIELPSTNTSETKKENSEGTLTKTLGVRDEKEENSSKGKVLAGIFGGIGVLLLLLPIVIKRNVKIYVEEEKEFKLGGWNRINSKNAKLDVNPYLDGETYTSKVKIILNQSISKKLDGKVLEIKHRENTIHHEIHYEHKPYEILLK